MADEKQIVGCVQIRVGQYEYKSDSLATKQVMAYHSPPAYTCMEKAGCVTQLLSNIQNTVMISCQGMKVHSFSVLLYSYLGKNKGILNIQRNDSE
ncbi:hypothetical protein [Bacillus sp. 1P06AnD]|uniref:hypothetical protein n=1 Tax=Bacillus sp. 1P06AnD TaxID=3132208 RepID=UPI0039A20B8C